LESVLLHLLHIITNINTQPGTRLVATVVVAGGGGGGGFLLNSVEEVVEVEV
jgi:hypothetical protein